MCILWNGPHLVFWRIWTIETARTILWNQPIEFISIATAQPSRYGGRSNLEKEAAILENEKTLETRLVFPYAFDRLERGLRKFWEDQKDNMKTKLKKQSKTGVAYHS